MLNDQEIERLRQAILATVASPIIGSIEDYTWEAIFHYIKKAVQLGFQDLTEQSLPQELG